MWLALYPEGAFEGIDVQVGFGQQFPELPVLALKLAQSLCVRDLHTAVLGTPLVEGGVAAPSIAAQLLDWHTGFGLLDKPDDLFLDESAHLHSRHSPG